MDDSKGVANLGFVSQLRLAGAAVLLEGYWVPTVREGKFLVTEGRLAIPGLSSSALRGAPAKLLSTAAMSGA